MAVTSTSSYEYGSVLRVPKQEKQSVGEILSLSPLQMPLHQSCETQAMPEPSGNVSEEILFAMGSSTKPLHLPTAFAALTKQHCWTPCLICE